MIHPRHLRAIIEATLHHHLSSEARAPAAVELLLLTAAHESHLGKYLFQLNDDGDPTGPARGVYQMERPTYMDTALRMPQEWKEDIDYLRSGFLVDPVAAWCFISGDLYFATAMARAYYWLYPHPLPAADDVEGLADYWHKAWCRGCKGTPKQAATAYRKLVLGQ